MGRHRLDRSAARRYRGAVMFTADEYERVQGAAAASSRTLSSWLRVLALRSVGFPLPATGHREPRPATPAQRRALRDERVGTLLQWVRGVRDSGDAPELINDN